MVRTMTDQRLPTSCRNRNPVIDSRQGARQLRGQNMPARQESVPDRALHTLCVITYRQNLGSVRAPDNLVRDSREAISCTGTAEYPPKGSLDGITGKRAKY